MKPIQAYPSMRAAVRELGTEGFVSAVLGRQRPAPTVTGGKRGAPQSGHVALAVFPGLSGRERRTPRR